MKKNNFREKIDAIIPYVCENFLTFPLWEEGKYIPHLNFWKIFGTEKEFLKFCISAKRKGEQKGYVVENIDNQYFDFLPTYNYNFSLSPAYKDLKDGSYKFVNEGWSIEEMVDLVVAMNNEQ